MTCPICKDTFTVIVAGPDYFGNYDADDCPCQLPDFDPDAYCEHGVPDGCDCEDCEHAARLAYNHGVYFRER